MAEVVVRPDNALAGVTGPLYLLLFPISIVCFLAALVTDIAYAASEFLMYLHFSQWMIAAGLAIGALAIGRLAIGRARMRRVEIDELVVHRLQVTDELETPSRHT